MNELHALNIAVREPGWWELLRTLWPVFLVIASLAIGGILLALKSMFATREAHRHHDDRLIVIETFVIEQKTALGILPTRQQLADEIRKQADRIAQTREEITEHIGDLGERIAEVKAQVAGISDQAKTTNTYLHTIIDRGLKS